MDPYTEQDLAERLLQVVFEQTVTQQKTATSKEAIAEVLGIGPSEVYRRTITLADDGLIRMWGLHGIGLTSRGQQAAQASAIRAEERATNDLLAAAYLKSQTVDGALNWQDLARSLEMDDAQAARIVDRLRREGLARVYTAPAFRLTSSGARAAEQQAAGPGPAGISGGVHFGTVNGPVQVGSHNQLTVHSLSYSAPADLLPTVNSLLERLPTLEIDQSTRTELKRDLKIVEAHLESDAPDTTALAKCRASLQRTLEGAAGAVLGGLAAGQVPHWMVELARVIQHLPPFHG